MNAFARRLGHSEARRQWVRPFLDMHVAQPYVVGGEIEVYDGALVIGRVTSEADEAAFLRGFEDGLSAFMGCTVHLAFVRDRGNGHRDYRIEAGPRPLERRGSKRQRHLARTRALQRERRAHRAWRRALAEVDRALVAADLWSGPVASW